MTVEMEAAGEGRLFERNLDEFLARFPGLAGQLQGGRQTVSTIVWEDGCAVDISVGGGRLHGRPASEVVREQIDTYFANPERIVLTQPEGLYGDSPVSLRLVAAMRDRLEERGVEIIKGTPQDRAGFLIVIGVGLGLHVLELVERTRPRALIIVEPYLEFLLHSLNVIDWRHLFEVCDEHDIAIRFVTASHPDAARGQLFQIIEAIGMVFLDGSYLFLHYRTWLTVNIYNDFKGQVQLRIVSKGFYEDEILMMRNAAANFSTRRFRLFDGAARQQRPEPAFVVGAGPSAGPAMAVVRKWQDRAMIFSSGSALQILLHHGIVPDYHVEIENLPLMVDKLAHIRDQYPRYFSEGRLRGTCFIGPATVDPGNLDFFEDSLLFFRDTVSSTRTFGGDFQHVMNAGPLASNTSVMVASVLGFTHIYLFGVDCGVRSADKHHSDETIYYTSEKFKGVAYEKFDFSYPANFGGVIYSDTLYDWSRQVIERVFNLFRVDAYNCSDGALIEGAVPKVPRSLSFSGDPLDKRAVGGDVHGCYRTFAPGEFWREHDPTSYLDAWDELIGDFEALIAAAMEEDEDFCDFFSRLREFWASSDGRYRNVGAMVDGSGRGLAHIGRFVLSRLEDPDFRRNLLKDFIELYGREVLGISREGREIFAGIIDRALRARDA